MAQETQDVIVDANDAGVGRSAETKSLLPFLPKCKKRETQWRENASRAFCVYVESTSALTEPSGITVGITLREPKGISPHKGRFRRAS